MWVGIRTKPGVGSVRVSGEGRKEGATPLVLSQAFSHRSQSSLINLILFPLQRGYMVYNKKRIIKY